MSDLRVSYDPPQGYPLGTNTAFKVGSRILIPIINTFTRRDWKGAENIPPQGPVIVASNHLSYLDVLVFAQFLYHNGRAPRFLGKASIFRTPIIGKILLAAGQVPVERESAQASKAIDHARAILEAGHMLGVYPEGTLTRDPNLWPMVAKTGLARLALITKAPVIPIAQWGSQKVLPTYSKKVHLFPRTTIIMRAGVPVDLSPWYGREDDPSALIEATAKVMEEITRLLEEIRGATRSAVSVDPQYSELPRTGNFKKSQKPDKSRRNRRGE